MEKYSLPTGKAAKMVLAPEVVVGVKVGQVTGGSDGLEFFILCIVPDLVRRNWRNGGRRNEKRKGWGFSLEELRSKRQAHTPQISERLSATGVRQAEFLRIHDPRP